MQPVKKILQFLNGLHYHTEYICLSRESLPQPMQVFLIAQGRIIQNITSRHLFLGYSPLVIGLLPVPGFEPGPELQLLFSHQSFQPNERFDQKDALAFLQLRSCGQMTAGTDTVALYEGVDGRHRFLSRVQQWAGSQINERYNKRPGNVFLTENLYKQVQIAYSVARTISLVTLKVNEGYNLFPTDLHGPVNDEFYLISLRLGGRALEQVNLSGRILLSELGVDAAKMAYELGKNHMRHVRPKNEFPFSPVFSQELGLPLPGHTVLYRELHLIESRPMGIHGVLLFRSGPPQKTEPHPETLAHIHNAYATWRNRNALPGNFLLL